MLRPFLIIGIGGSGGKTLRGLKSVLELRLTQKNWNGGWPKAWQFLHIDTPVIQDGQEFPAPFLPAENYLGLVATGNTYDTVYESVRHGGRIPNESLADVEKPLPSPLDVRVPITLGAGQFRAIGRTIAVSKLSKVRDAADRAIARLNSADSRGQLQKIGELFNATSDAGVASPIVIIISSIAGGSGAGAFLDVTEAVKSAAGGDDWRDSIFSILYAPDVFDQIDGKGGIGPNALAALSESMAGLWIGSPTDSTIHLYKSQGVIPSIGPRYAIGPAFTYLVGRQNTHVNFGSQTEVYKAISASVATWITDDKVQDNMLAYSVANYVAQATDVNVLPDYSKLNDAGKQAPPFSSIGFGRISLGKDRFFQYCSERLARSSIDRLLYQHVAEDPMFKERTEPEWISYKTDLAFPSFLESIGLNERGNADEVINALRPNREARNAELRNFILSNAQQGLDKNGGQDLTSWHTKIMHWYQAQVPTYLDQEATARNERSRVWVKTISEKIIKVVGNAVAQQGMRVASEMLNRLFREIKEVADELDQEREQFQRYAADANGYVFQQLQAAAGQETIRPDHPSVAAGLEQAVNAAGWIAESDLRETAASLLRDIRDNFIDPLKIEISGTYEALKQRVEAPNEIDGRENEYNDWPKFESSLVPKRFYPAQNERLLISVDKYPNEFKTLVDQSVIEDRRENASRIVVDEVILGSLAIELPKDEDKSWELIEISQPWIPKDRKARIDSTQADQSAKFFMSTNPHDFVTRAGKWMERSDQAFAAYLNENLVDYLSGTHLDRGEIAKRLGDFKEQFSAAVSASEPLIKLNPGLLSVTHGKEVGLRTSVVSAIPFQSGSDIYNIIKEIFIGYKMWDEKKSEQWFRNSNVQSIDIFSLQSNPYQPMVIDSVMKPIAQQWVSSSTEVTKRESFWKWRRARTLSESLPTSQTNMATIIRGWFVAKLLTLLESDTSDKSRGPKISVWINRGEGHVSFPHPLLHPGIASPNDFVGVVLQSLTIALVVCNAEGSLTPLKPYHRLLELGGTSSDVCDELRTWIQKGITDDGSPQPDKSRAGSKEDSIDDRRKFCIEWVNREISEFNKNVVGIDPHGDIRAYPVSWEIRNNVLLELENLKTQISKVQSDTTGV